MNIVIDEKTIAKEPLANLTYRKLRELVDDDDAYLYYNFLLDKGDIESEKIEARLLLLSRKYGIYVFDPDSSPLDDDIRDRMETVYVEMSGRLSHYTELRARRGQLKYDIHTAVVGDVRFADSTDELCIQCAVDDIEELLMVYQPEEKIPENDFNLIHAVLTGSVSLKQKKDRGDVRENSMGGVLSEIEHYVSSFDIDQIKGYDIDVDMPQRIRGLAGSGKTVILTMKAAKFHAENPDARILYTYYTRALGGSIKNGISRAFKHYSKKKIDWSKITVCHGWGSPSQEGVYYNACVENDYVPMSFREAEIAVGSKRAFAYICGELQKKELKPLYDMILIDEGQDFPKEFYQLCLRLCKTNRICWAYDEFQNIFDTTIQNERDTFGYDAEGIPYVDFGEDFNGLQDIPLKKCYRTPRISLISAFALGLGIYNKKVLQRLQSNQQWEALGFEVKKGESKTGDEMVVSRPNVNTPSYSNETFTEKSLQIYNFGSFDDECKAVAKMIVHYIKDEQVLPNDICVICIDQKYVGSYLETIAAILRGMGVFPYVLLDSKTTEFFQEGMVTLSTVNKAKGNECGVVIICGADAVFKSPNNVVMRDKLFTSMTRTKGWLTLTGCSEHMASLEKEYQALKDHNYELHFVQPAEEDTKNIENVSKAESKFEENFYNQLAKLRHSGIEEKEIRKLLENIMSTLDSGKG